MSRRIQDGRPMTQDELADWFTQPLQMRRGDRELYVRVNFFRRKDDGTTEIVHTAGVSPAVPITYAYDGIDWDMNRTFLHSPIMLYADFDEWREYVREEVARGADSKDD